MLRLSTFLLLFFAMTVHGQQRFSAGTMPPPEFEDAERRQKLAQAFPEIEKIFLDWARRRHAPGAVLGVIIDGELAWLKMTGVRNVDSGEPVESDTLFRIASMTKSFTAMAILRLRDEGKLGLDDPVSRHVPQLGDLPYPTRDSPPITIRHLLNHAEGFPEDNPWGDRQLAQSNETMDSWMSAGIPFSNAPGTRYEYSNYGFAILGRIVENVSGVPYDRYVRDNILGPLGMERSAFDVPAENFAAGYRREDEQWKPEPILAHGSFGAMGGLWTTATELSRYVAFLMAAFPPRDDAESGPIRRSSAREMQQSWRAISASALRAPIDASLELTSTGYGYGLRTSGDCRFAHLVAHGGGLPGYGSFMQWLPEYGVGMIGMSNLRYNSPAGLIGQAWDVLLRTGALKPRVARPSPALLAAKEDVSRLVAKWDDALLERIVADNLFLDRSAERRAAQLGDLVKRHGQCRPEPGLEAPNALRGKWRMTCDRGWIDVSITLAPTTPPRVQYLDVESVMPPGESMSALLNSVLQLAGRWNDRTASRLLHKSADRALVRRQLAALSQWGTCRPQEAVAGDGTGRSSFMLQCQRGRVRMRVSRHPESGRLLRLDVFPGPDQRCAP